MGDITPTNLGTSWYWTTTAVMALSTIGFMAWSVKVPKERRIFHYITAAITLVASLAYFTMASNLGHAAVPVQFQRNNPAVVGESRQIFYVRYIDWVITTPVR